MTDEAFLESVLDLISDTWDCGSQNLHKHQTASFSPHPGKPHTSSISKRRISPFDTDFRWFRVGSNSEFGPDALQFHLNCRRIFVHKTGWTEQVPVQPWCEKNGSKWSTYFLEDCWCPGWTWHLLNWGTTFVLEDSAGKFAFHSITSESELHSWTKLGYLTPAFAFWKYTTGVFTLGANKPPKRFYLAVILETSHSPWFNSRCFRRRVPIN